MYSVFGNNLSHSFRTSPGPELKDSMKDAGYVYKCGTERNFLNRSNIRHGIYLPSTLNLVIKEISINDFVAVEQYIDETEKFNFFKDLAKLATNKYKETILPSYYMGRFYEETGNPEKAMHIYRSAYNMDDIAGITKEYLLQRADAIADKYGY